MADIRKLINTGPDKDSLRTAFPILNMVIDSANESLNTANSALTTSQSADAKADSVQEQFNQVVIQGDSSVEAAQARVSSSQTFTTLKERLDNSDAQLADVAINVKNFGAVDDRVTNNTSQIQAAIDYASANGYQVLIPKNVLYNRGGITTKNVMVIDDSGVKRQISGTAEWDVSYNTELEYIGHRGLLSLYPEGSNIAFKNSIGYKQAHSIEFDIRNSVDEALFVFHDTTLDAKTTGTGAIKDLTDAQVRSADLGVKFSPIYEGEKIPYLHEACSVIRGLDVKYIYPQSNVGEITDSTLKKRILEGTINTFKTYGLLNKVVLQCIGSSVASLIRDINSEIKIGLMVGSTVSEFNTALAWAKLDRNCLIGMDKSFWLANTTLPMSCRKEGIDVFTYTVNNAYDVDKLRKINVYKIMTDVNLMGVR